MFPAIGNSVIAPAVVIRPILFAFSVNQSAPSEPAAIPYGSADTVGIGYSVNTPAVVTRPILLPADSVNQRAPSGPETIVCGELFGVGGTNVVTVPDVVIRLIPLPPANHRLPSDPTVMLSD